MAVVKSFREGRDAVQNNLRTGRLHVENNTVQLLAFLLDTDRVRLTTREVAAEVGVYRKTVVHILHEILGYRKLACVGYPMQFPKCNYSTVMQSHRPCWTGTEPLHSS